MDNQHLLAALKAACTWDFDRWAYDEWERLNHAYFDNTLEVGQITWGLTAYGRCIGLHSGWRNHITLHQSLIERDENWQGGIRGRERIASDVLLHEMIHQSIHQRLGHSGCGDNTGGCTSHNNAEWVSEINRIAPLLDLPANAAVIKQKRVKAPGASGKGKVVWYVEPGKMDRGQLSQFPHCMRPAGYYQNVPYEIANRLG